MVTSDGSSPIWTNHPIAYKIGESYEVKDANTDPNQDCGAGINLASMDWILREYQDGYRVLIANTPGGTTGVTATVTSLSWSCVGITPGQHYASVTAFNTWGGESARSAEVPFTYSSAVPAVPSAPAVTAP